MERRSCNRLKHMYKIVLTFILTACMLAASITADAEIPYTSYTYWSDVGTEPKEVYNRPMYVTDKVIDAHKLGISGFKSLNDICTDAAGKIYLLDSTSRIVVLTNELALDYELGPIGGTETYNDAASLYVHSDSTIYICDTEGHRVLHADPNGKLLNIITLPESSLIPESFDFRPISITIDPKGCMYILSEGSYYGALLYDEHSRFLGFYGANAVTSGVTDILINIFNRVFPNNIKKGNTASKIPYSFVDIKADKNGFIYTCNGYTEKYQNQGQIRKLSPGTGKNILNSSEINFTDTPVNTKYASGAFAKQDIMNIEIDGSGFIYALESVFGKVFLYDADCRMLTSFGGGMHEGTQNGSFVNVSGLALLDDGETVLVSDSVNNNITVFKINDFGRQVKHLDVLTLSGKYEAAESGWKEVLKQDNCCQLAYSGIASARVYAGDYTAAMEYAKIGYDRQTYAVAFEYYRSEMINKHFVLISILALLVVTAAAVALILSMRKKITIIKNQEVKCFLNTLIHPADTFACVKEKGMGSILISAILVVTFYVSVVLQTLNGGFLFTKYDPESFNSLWVMARSIGLVVLWIAANWLVCSLLGGEGKLREITIVTCYSLLPLIIKNFITLLLTNILLPAEANFLSILNVVAFLYCMLIIICGLLKIHDFSFSRMVATSVLSLAGAAIIFFLIIMLIMLFQQVIGFAATVISELFIL